MVGDPSVVPAIAASLARVPAGRLVHVLLQGDGPEDELPLESPGDLRVQWLHGGGDELLADALRALEWPAGAVHAFVHGEASAVRAVRRHLLAERGAPARVGLDLRLLEAHAHRRGLARGQAGVEPARRGRPHGCVKPRISCAVSSGTSSCGEWPTPSSTTQSAFGSQSSR